VHFAGYTNRCLNTAVDLVNTLGVLSGRERLVDGAALEDFLVAQRVGHEGAPTARDLGEVRKVRTRLRAVFEAESEPEAAQLVNELVAYSGAVPQLVEHDGEGPHWHYTPFDAPIAKRLAANSAMALGMVIAEGEFDRLSVCSGGNCRDVFVDTSRNRSRRYCSPDLCGNRASVAAFRARKRAMVD
jgi:predicted RNA-binding Zn ribbon-like protein